MMGSTIKKQRISNILKTLIIPIAIYLVLLASTGGRFGTSASLLLVFRQSVILIIIAMAIGLNMTMGMWDFSAGAVVIVAAMIGGAFAKATGSGVPGMIVICMAVAIGLSALSGFLYNLIKVPSIVLSIGLCMAYEAIPRLFSISLVQIKPKDAILAQSPWCFIILGVMFIIFYIIFNYTVLGHNVKLIGANQTIANNAGVNIPRVKFISFLCGGVFLGVASFLYMANVGALTAPSAFGSVAIIFDAMMGIFIGFFLMRYCNFIVGIVAGVISMSMLNSGLVVLGLQPTMRSVTSGLFLLVVLMIASNQSVVDDMRRRKVFARKADELYEHTTKPKEKI